MTEGDGLRLTRLDIASGVPTGPDGDAPQLPAPLGCGPMAALEDAVLGALLHQPCVVSFSGGRDSSAILAVATRVARQERLPPPVPVTLRFPEASDANEDAWQERVVRHLRLDDWVRLEFSDDLDFIGPVAAGVLRRHGLVWPPNTHFHLPIIQQAKGGAVLTGIDGDGLLGSWAWSRAARMLTRRVRPEPRDVLRVLLALSPKLVRRAVHGRGGPPALPWLRPSALAAVGRAWTAESASEPARWNHRIGWFARRRRLRMTVRHLQLLADDAGVRALHPFTEPAFLAELAAAGGWMGLGDRTAIMRLLFAGLLPDDTITRQTKGRFNTTFWNRFSRRFIADWDGRGVDLEMVNPDALRTEWSKPTPIACSSTLLQAAWLASDAGVRNDAPRQGT